MTRFFAVATAIALAATTLAVLPAAHAMRVDNFVLLDQKGDAHELYYHSNAKAIVVMIQGNGCPLVRNSLTDFKALRDTYADKGVHFFMLNTNLQDNRESIAAEAQKWGIDVPILVDETQIIAESLGVVRTAEMLVIEPRTWKVVYRGPINDRVDYERQKAVATANYAADSLDAVIAGKAVEVATRETKGCLINMAQANKPHDTISYSKTIAPMLQENCVVCHTDGGIAPWAMSNYTMVRGFAPMIREVLRTKRMPPWHADPHVGQWQDDRSLAVNEIQTLVHWIEAGAKRGTGPDPLAEEPYKPVEWPLGTPDLVISIPEFTVPASGVVDYQFPAVKNPLNEGVWVRAATVVPGDREVVHHILAGSLDDDASQGKKDSNVFDNYIIGYAPGNESSHMPEGTGVYIPPGGTYQFQLHYTPVGREAVDRSKIGLYFHKEPPTNFLRQEVVLNPALHIPPGESRHQEVAYYEFDREALLYSMVPHSHYRGVASKFELVKADGSTQLLLSVPNYDFNWQRTYEFTEPVKVPAGARLVHRTWYDNSAQNPGNPDPERTVPWGLQSWDEMLYGAFTYRWLDETSDKPTHNKQLAEVTQFVGFIDRNMDGKVSWSELPKRMKKRLVQGFKGVDTDGDGGLNIQEMYNMQHRQTAGAR